MAPASAWTDAEDRKLLLCLVYVGIADPNKWDKIVPVMEGRTGEGCNQRFKKLRKEVPKQLADLNKGTGTATGPVPRPKKRAAPKKEEKRVSEEDGSGDSADEGSKKKVKAEIEGEADFGALKGTAAFEDGEIDGTEDGEVDGA